MKKKKSKSVYVVTRNGRRIEEDNYFGEEQAKERAVALVAMLKKWGDSDRDRVEVVATSKPYKIW